MGKKEYKVTDETGETLLRELPKLPEGMFWRITPGVFNDVLNTSDIMLKIVRRKDVLERKTFRIGPWELEYGKFVVPKIEFEIIDSKPVNEVTSLKQIIFTAIEMKNELEARDRSKSLVEKVVGDYEVGADVD